MTVKTGRETTIGCTLLTLVSSKRIILAPFSAVQIENSKRAHSVNGTVSLDYIWRGPLQAISPSVGPIPTPLYIQSLVLTHTSVPQNKVSWQIQ